jgi:hypothetical protein
LYNDSTCVDEENYDFRIPFGKNWIGSNLLQERFATLVLCGILSTDNNQFASGSMKSGATDNGKPGTFQKRQQLSLSENLFMTVWFWRVEGVQ